MDIDAIYARALGALQAGQLTESQRLLVQVIQADPRYEQAWLSLASVLTDPDQKLDCLERVIAINPDNEQALTLLDEIRTEKVRLEVLSMLAGPAPEVEKETVSLLGKYLLNYQFITPGQLDTALAEQQKSAGAEKPKKLGEILVEQGVITSQQLDQAVRDQFQDFNNLFVG